MSSDHAEPAPVPPAALAAFVRGIQRRATVFAELHTGDPAVGDAAVAAAIRDWPAISRETAMGDWPVSFWSLLLSQPQLRVRVRTPVSLSLQASDRLGELALAARVALLLRLVAGLEEGPAAAAQGVTEPEYRLALEMALPSAPDGSPDMQVWGRLSDEIQRRIRTLPPTRLPRLGSTREAVQHQDEHLPDDHQPRRSVHPPRRWWLIGLWIVLAILAIAVVAMLLPQAAAGQTAVATSMPAIGGLPHRPVASWQRRRSWLPAATPRHAGYLQVADATRKEQSRQRHG